MTLSFMWLILEDRVLFKCNLRMCNAEDEIYFKLFISSICDRCRGATFVPTTKYIKKKREIGANLIV